MTDFVRVNGCVIRTDHVSAVGSAVHSPSKDHDGHFPVYMVGCDRPLNVYAKGRRLTAERNKLLRAMGAGDTI